MRILPFAILSSLLLVGACTSPPEAVVPLTARADHAKTWYVVRNHQGILEGIYGVGTGVPAPSLAAFGDEATVQKTDSRDLGSRIAWARTGRYDTMDRTVRLALNALVDTTIDRACPAGHGPAPGRVEADSTVNTFVGGAIGLGISLSPADVCPR